MSKVTSKMQLTVPKAIATQYGIRVGDELEWIPAGEAIRVRPAHRKAGNAQDLTLEERLELFDRGTARLNKIQARQLRKTARSRTRGTGRGWTREELYARGRSR
jgi:bifunctional DNA-binding transcriptional regulator/antitoxin component of YhaV-PrlF toxin-antitoxin module